MSEPSVIVAFITGQSDSTRNDLSPVQSDFLARSPVPESQWMLLNFPYTDSAPWRETSLVTASINNAKQYLASRRENFPQTYRGVFLSKLGNAKTVILLAGSCGLELLGNLHLPPEMMRKIHVLAYGPVSRALPVCASLELVQGHRDWISRCWHRHVDHLISCGHMDYLECGEMMERFSQFYERVIRKQMDEDA